MESCDIGDAVSIRTYSAAGEGFKNASDALTDPATVTLKIEEPDGVEATYTYALTEITRDAAGRFSRLFTPTKAGVHYYRWVGTGAVAAAFEGAFFVRTSKF